MVLIGKRTHAPELVTFARKTLQEFNAERDLCERFVYPSGSTPTQEWLCSFIAIIMLRSQRMYINRWRQYIKYYVKLRRIAK